jgi:hypothetical protein
LEKSGANIGHGGHHVADPRNTLQLETHPLEDNDEAEAAAVAAAIGLPSDLATVVEHETLHWEHGEGGAAVAVPQITLNEGKEQGGREDEADKQARVVNSDISSPESSMKSPLSSEFSASDIRSDRSDVTADDVLDKAEVVMKSPELDNLPTPDISDASESGSDEEEEEEDSEVETENEAATAGIGGAAKRIQSNPEHANEVRIAEEKAKEKAQRAERQAREGEKRAKEGGTGKGDTGAAAGGVKLGATSSGKKEPEEDDDDDDEDEEELVNSKLANANAA